MYETTLSQPARLRAERAALEITHVHLSQDVWRSDFDSGSRVLVAFSVEHHGERAARFDPRALRLSLIDAEGRRHTAGPLATGRGEPPQVLHDGEFTEPLMLPPRKRLRAWAAFGGFPERIAAEIPERVVLELAPDAGAGKPVATALSQPGSLPLWHADPPAFSPGLGLSGQLWPGGSALNFTFSATRYWIDPLWLSWSTGVGLHSGEESFADPDDPCCNLALRAQLGVPVLRHRRGVISPYLGGELALLAGGPSDDSRILLGPSLGVSLGMRPIQLGHGPFPVVYDPSALSELNLDLGFVWWHGAGTGDLGDPGFVLSVTWNLGQ